MVRELAAEILADPHASDLDRAHAREALMSRPIDVERLDEPQLSLLEQILAIAEGRATEVTIPSSLSPSVDMPRASAIVAHAECQRCVRFSDDDLAEVDAALAADVG